MTKIMNVDVAARQFQICGEFVEARPYGNGHINDTYRVVFRQGSAPAFYMSEMPVIRQLAEAIDQSE